jgi:hypothetical protein
VCVGGGGGRRLMLVTLVSKSGHLNFKLSRPSKHGGSELCCELAQFSRLGNVRRVSCALVARRSFALVSPSHLQRVVVALDSNHKTAPVLMHSKCVRRSLPAQMHSRWFREQGIDSADKLVAWASVSKDELETKITQINKVCPTIACAKQNHHSNQSCSLTCATQLLSTTTCACMRKVLHWTLLDRGPCVWCNWPEVRMAWPSQRPQR